MSNETPAAVPSHSLREAIRNLPPDVVALFGLAAVGLVVYALPSLFGPVPTTLVGLPLLLFAPGYALLAILYPASNDRRTHVVDATALESEGHWLDWPTRGALSLGTSVALVPLLALGCSVVGLELTILPTVIALLVAIGAVAAARRRSQLPPAHRLEPPFADRLAGSRPSISSLRSVGSATTILLAVGVLLATSTLGYALVVPNDGEAYTSLSLATENESGDLVSGSFPSEIDTDEERELVAVVENAEGERTSYTLLVELQRVDDGDGTTEVTERTELHRFTPEIEDGERWERSHAIRPEEPGDDLRLTYSLYRGDAPSDPAAEEPYRQTYVWIDVEPGDTE